MTYEELLIELDSVFICNSFSLKIIRAVVELHSPKIREGKDWSYVICTGCYEEEGGNYDYPCPTIQVIEKELTNGTK